MGKGHTYTLVPENKRNVICSHYGTREQIDRMPAINGYLVIDLGMHVPDMQGKHNAVWNACKNHSYSSAVEDILKAPEAERIAKPLAGADASAAVPAPDNFADQAEYDTYRANWDAAYDSAYPTHYATAFAGVVIDPVQLSLEQARAFMLEYEIVLEDN